MSTFEQLPVSRRTFMKGGAVFLGAAALSACVSSSSDEFQNSFLEAGEDVPVPQMTPSEGAFNDNLRALIVYDSVYGNTQKIAEVIQQTIQQHCDSRLVKATTVQPEDLDGVNFLIVGSPTHGGWYIESVKGFLESLPDQGMNNCYAAAFDTSSTKDNQGKVGKLLIDVFGNASPRIEKELIKKGALMVGKEIFYVFDKEGPLKQGEMDRAREWADSIVQKILHG